jgi:hypothetical protein
MSRHTSMTNLNSRQKYEPTFAILRTACGCEQRIKFPRPNGRFIVVPLMFPIKWRNEAEGPCLLNILNRRFEIVGWRSPTEMEYQEVLERP